MDRWIRWVVAILVVAAIIGLITFARGTPEHGGAKAASAGAGSVTLTV